MVSRILRNTTSMVFFTAFISLFAPAMSSPVGACHPLAESTLELASTTPPAPSDVDRSPFKVSVLQLLQVIDDDPRYTVIFHSGEDIEDLQLEEQKVHMLHLFDLEQSTSRMMAMNVLRMLGWTLHVVNSPAEESRFRSIPIRTRGTSRDPVLKVVFATPPVSLEEDPFQSTVIPLKHSSLDDTFKALREMSKFWDKERVEVVAAPSTNSIVLFASNPNLIQRCKILIDQMELVALQQQEKSSQDGENEKR